MLSSTWYSKILIAKEAFVNVEDVGFHKIQKDNFDF